MKPNVIMIGIPSSGKDTIGVLLAKRLGFSFADADIVIQEKGGRPLKEIITQKGMDGSLKVGERINAELDVALFVITPGGSVIHGEKAVERLREVSGVVYLKTSYEEMEKRIGNMVNRDVTLKSGSTLRDLYNERISHHERYADITIDEEGKTPGDAADVLRDTIEGMMDRSITERVVGEQKKILEEKNRKIEAYEAEIAVLEEEFALLRTAETV